MIGQLQFCKSSKIEPPSRYAYLQTVLRLVEGDKESDVDEPGILRKATTTSMQPFSPDAVSPAISFE